MKYLILITLLSVILNIYCQEIADPIDNNCFVIERKDMFLNLPINLKKEAGNGWAALQLDIDSTGVLEKVKLIKLRLNGEKKITYTPGVTLNQTENKYFYILLPYAKELKIRRIQKQKVAKNSKISIMVKLK